MSARNEIGLTFDSRENNFRVKSVSMATFKPEEVKHMQEGGNKLSNAKYLARFSAKDGGEPDSTWDIDQVRISWL